MLSHIHIKDFAIIEDMTASFDKGLSIITGETGSGKSIIIEAVNLALGNRADSSFVRSGKEKAIIEVAFDDCADSLFELLDEDPEECENQLIIKREINNQGKSNCKINGKMVTLSTLRAVTSRLADIHGQYDHQSLLNEDKHIELLDLFYGEQISPLKQEFASLFSDYKKAKDDYEALLSDELAMREDLELKEFELKELTAANLKEGEDEALSEQIYIMQNSEKIFSNFSESYALLYEEAGSVIEKLALIKEKIYENSEFDADYKALSEVCEDSYYKLEDLASELRLCRNRLEFSPEDLEEALIRESELRMLMRKYKKSLSDLIAYRDGLGELLGQGLNFEAQKDRMKKKFELLSSKLKDKAQILSAKRIEGASKLEAEIAEQLADLNFMNAKFSIATDVGMENLSASGIDKVQFLLSANRGEPLKPLAKIASGGEMSRIMLAFKKALADYDNIPTMIFDEIDTGISGRAASVVANKLREISKTHQILCITHLPQIAASGDKHYEIKKSSDSTSTKVELLPLSEQERLTELARLLGGTSITEATLKNAEELILSYR